MKSIIIAAALISAASCFISLKQCDQRWANDTMFTKPDGTNVTLCQGGSTVVALSMVLEDCDVRILNNVADPKVLNKWL